MRVGLVGVEGAEGVCGCVNKNAGAIRYWTVPASVVGRMMSRLFILERLFCGGSSAAALLNRQPDAPAL